MGYARNAWQGKTKKHYSDQPSGITCWVFLCGDNMEGEEEACTAVPILLKKKKPAQPALVSLIIAFIKFFSFECRVKCKRLITVHTHIHSAKNFGMLPAVRAFNLHGACGKQADPTVYNCTSDDT